MNNLKNTLKIEPNRSYFGEKEPKVANEIKEGEYVDKEVAQGLLDALLEMKGVIGHLSGRMGEQMEIEVNEMIDKEIKKATE